MQQVRNELIKALTWENAHASFTTATKDLDLETIGDDSHDLPYTIWQLTEHIRFAQKDIVDFSFGTDYQEPNWPDDYWPESNAPESMEEWKHCLAQVQQDRQRLLDLIRDESNELFEPFPHGSGQHLFREAMLVIDHEAYHTGQIVLIRKLLGKW